jgi:ribonuclease HI
MKEVAVFVDGAIAGGRQTGVAAVARTGQGQFLGWISRRLEKMTNNEAEYKAVLLGLELARSLKAETVEIVTDSQVVVHQMRGYSRVNSPRLKTLHQQACLAVRYFRQVRFRHVGRKDNKLADALAAEALLGKTVSS